MTNEKFKSLIEAPVVNEKDMLRKIELRSAIARAVRITLQYPEQARQYYDSLPRAANENIPKISE